MATPSSRPLWICLAKRLAGAEDVACFSDCEEPEQVVGLALLKVLEWHELLGHLSPLESSRRMADEEEVTVAVWFGRLGLLIGKGGAAIRRVQSSSGCSIRIGISSEALPRVGNALEMRRVSLRGTAAQIAEAKVRALYFYILTMMFPDVRVTAAISL